MNRETIDKLLDLSGKTAIVTAGGAGIGRECCLILARAGANVMVSSRTYSHAREVADEIISEGGTADAIAADVSDDNALQEIVKATIDRFGAINILVNNAGRANGGREDPLTVTTDYVELMFRINVIAPWRLTSLCAPHMQKAGYGSVINISSMSSVDKSPRMFVYGATKAALNHMAANLAFDLGPMGIRINNVGPGATRTGALQSVLTPEIERSMLRHTPLGRLGETSDIATAVLFFAAPASAWISGQTLFVNGGGSQTLE
ncbi:MAG: glucose 1-dehydrogenase [Bacteroidales bacterium]|nr:glucose 1-dehydrogenase [Bacteroidales bacterium]